MFALVEILLHPTGDTPIIKKKKWSLESNRQVAFISDFVKKLIKCEPHESLVRQPVHDVVRWKHIARIV